MRAVLCNQSLPKHTANTEHACHDLFRSPRNISQGTTQTTHSRQRCQKLCLQTIQAVSHRIVVDSLSHFDNQAAEDRWVRVEVHDKCCASACTFLHRRSNLRLLAR